LGWSMMSLSLVLTLVVFIIVPFVE
jgi:hypothetical protein